MKITMPRARSAAITWRSAGSAAVPIPGAGARQRAGERRPVPRARPRRRDGADRLIEGDQAGGVVLPQQHECEGCGEASGVVELGEALRRPGPCHRRAGIEHQHGAQVGFLLELLHVEAVGAAQELPVHVAWFVAKLVLPVLGKLDRKPAPRRTVQAGEKALDNALGEDFETAKPRDVVWLQEIGASRGARAWTWGVRSKSKK